MSIHNYTISYYINNTQRNKEKNMTAKMLPFKIKVDLTDYLFQEIEMRTVDQIVYSYTELTSDPSYFKTIAPPGG